MKASFPSSLIAIVLGGALTTGCGEDFPPFNRLTTARVLAISAEPSTPAPGETTNLRAFSYIPEVGAGWDLPGVTYSWSWCPFAAPDGTCSVTPAQVAMLAQSGITLPPFDLGTGTSAQFTHSIPAAALEQICASLKDAPVPVNCVGGFPVQIKAIAKFSGATVSPTGTDEIVTVSTLRLRFSPKHTANTSPRIEALNATIGDETFPIGLEPAAILKRDEETVVKAVVSEAAVEKYWGRDEKLVEREVSEFLRLTWFVETGTTDAERTSYAEAGERNQAGDVVGFKFDPMKFARALRNKWTPAKTKDYAKNLARLIVIVRDDRGGVDVRDGFVNLEATP